MLTINAITVRLGGRAILERATASLPAKSRVGLIGRNEENRMRVVGAEVTLHLGHPASAFERLERILDQFEQFCTVSQSVAAALPIQLTVLDSDGVKLKG